jgi:hypothetical protein
LHHDTSAPTVTCVCACLRNATPDGPTIRAAIEANLLEALNAALLANPGNRTLQFHVARIVGAMAVVNCLMPKSDDLAERMLAMSLVQDIPAMLDQLRGTEYEADLWKFLGEISAPAVLKKYLLQLSVVDAAYAVMKSETGSLDLKFGS